MMILKIWTILLLIDPELNRAYKLYNRYLHFNKATYKDLDKIRKDLYMFFQEFRLAKSEELHKIEEKKKNDALKRM